MLNLTLGTRNKAKTTLQCVPKAAAAAFDFHFPTIFYNLSHSPTLFPSLSLSLSLSLSRDKDKIKVKKKETNDRDRA